MIQRIDTGTAKSFRRLWCAVVIQAVADLDLPIPKVRPNRLGNEKMVETAEAIRKDATDWFASLDTDIGSFNWICTALDLDAERIFNMTLTREGRSKLRGNDKRFKSVKKEEESDEADSD